MTLLCHMSDGTDGSVNFWQMKDGPRTHFLGARRGLHCGPTRQTLGQPFDKVRHPCAWGTWRQNWDFSKKILALCFHLEQSPKFRTFWSRLAMPSCLKIMAFEMKDLTYGAADKILSSRANRPVNHMVLHFWNIMRFFDACVSHTSGGCLSIRHILRRQEEGSFRHHLSPYGWVNIWSSIWQGLSPINAGTAELHESWLTVKTV